MNPVLQQIYATVVPSAPFVIAAYVLIWVALLAYVVFITVRLKRTEAHMAVLEEALADRRVDTANSIRKKDVE